MDTRWRITNDEQRMDLTRSGTFEAIREITFEMLETGRTGTVIIALRNYTPEAVQSEVAAMAARIAAVADLSGN